MTAPVERRHRELAVRVMFPESVAGSLLHYWAAGGEGVDMEDSPVCRVALAIAEAESSGAEQAWKDGVRYAAGFIREHANTLTDFAGKRAVELAALVLLRRSREDRPAVVVALETLTDARKGATEP